MEIYKSIHYSPLANELQSEKTPHTNSHEQSTMVGYDKMSPMKKNMDFRTDVIGVTTSQIMLISC